MQQYDKHLMTATWTEIGLDLAGTHPEISDVWVRTQQQYIRQCPHKPVRTGPSILQESTQRSIEGTGKAVSELRKSKQKNRGSKRTDSATDTTSSKRPLTRKSAPTSSRPTHYEIILADKNDTEYNISYYHDKTTSQPQLQTQIPHNKSNTIQNFSDTTQHGRIHQEDPAHRRSSVQKGNAARRPRKRSNRENGIIFNFLHVTPSLVAENVSTDDLPHNNVDPNK